jgi:hypothetical protein
VVARSPEAQAVKQLIELFAADNAVVEAAAGKPAATGRAKPAAARLS